MDTLAEYSVTPVGWLVGALVLWVAWGVTARLVYWVVRRPFPSAGTVQSIHGTVDNVREYRDQFWRSRPNLLPQLTRVLLGVVIGTFAAGIALANVSLVNNITEMWFRSGEIMWVPIYGYVDKLAFTVAAIFVGAEAGLGALFFVAHPGFLGGEAAEEDGHMSPIVGIPVGLLVVAAILAEAYLSYLQASAGLEGTGMFAGQTGPAAFALGFFFSSMEIMGSGVGLHLAFVPLMRWGYQVLGSGVLLVLEHLIAWIAFPSALLLRTLGGVNAADELRQDVREFEEKADELMAQVDAITQQTQAAGGGE
jgi:hypothetical protein